MALLSATVSAAGAPLEVGDARRPPAAFVGQVFVVGCTMNGCVGVPPSPQRYLYAHEVWPNLWKACNETKQKGGGSRRWLSCHEGRA